MKMKRIMMVVCAALFSMVINQAAFASDQFGSPEEAEALVKKAVAEIKAVGKDKAFQEINNRKGKFVDRDLYIFVFDMKGTNVAHGFNPKLIGKNLYDVKDPDGKYYVRERLELINAKGKGWHDYRYTNPVTRKIEQKMAYVERVGDLIVGCGAYKR